jgi:SAM-dependent methyltransferase
MLEIRHDQMEEFSNLKLAYEEIYEHEGINHRDSLYLWLIKQLSPRPGCSLVDISCGQGRLVVLAQKQGLQATGLDFSFWGVKKGSQAEPRSGWVEGDGEMLPFADHSFDYLTHIGSLEHYLAPEKGMGEIARILKRGGKACILLPNAFGFWGNIKQVLLTGEIHDDGQPLQRYATRRTWEKMLSAAGLRIDKVLGYGEVEWPLTRRDWLWYLTHPVKIARGAVSAATPVNLANHFVFLASHV